MEGRRYQFIEHEILKLIVQRSDHLGYPADLPQLAALFRATLPDITGRELVDTLRRLRPYYLTLWKWSDEHDRFVEYPAGLGDDGEFFYRRDFRLRRTPLTDLYLQELGAKLYPQDAKSPIEVTMTEEQRKARFERWEKLGVDRIKSDLMHTGGIRDVGGPPEVRELAWEWVRMKEEEAKATATSHAPPSGLTIIADSRLAELRALSSSEFDFRKLIRVCEELNTVYADGCYFATAMLTRGLLDHVPPLFGKNSFSEVANNYGGGRSFKETMHHLENAARNVADAHLHMSVRNRETLPTAQQVNFAAQLDVLLSEIVRVHGADPNNSSKRRFKSHR